MHNGGWAGTAVGALQIQKHLVVLDTLATLRLLLDRARRAKDPSLSPGLGIGMTWTCWLLAPKQTQSRRSALMLIAQTVRVL